MNRNVKSGAGVCMVFCVDVYDGSFVVVGTGMNVCVIAGWEWRPLGVESTLIWVVQVSLLHARLESKRGHGVV